MWWERTSSRVTWQMKKTMLIWQYMLTQALSLVSLLGGSGVQPFELTGNNMIKDKLHVGQPLVRFDWDNVTKLCTIVWTLRHSHWASIMSIIFVTFYYTVEWWHQLNQNASLETSVLFPTTETYGTKTTFPNFCPLYHMLNIIHLLSTCSMKSIHKVLWQTRAQDECVMTKARLCSHNGSPQRPQCTCTDSDNRNDAIQHCAWRQLNLCTGAFCPPFYRMFPKVGYQVGGKARKAPCEGLPNNTSELWWQSWLN